MGQSLVRPCQTHVRPNHRKHPNLLILLDLSCHCDSSQVDCEAFNKAKSAVRCSISTYHIPSYSIIFLSLHDLARPCNSLPLSCLKLETLLFLCLQSSSNIRRMLGTALCTSMEPARRERGQLHWKIWKCNLLNPRAPRHHTEEHRQIIADLSKHDEIFRAYPL